MPRLNCSVCFFGVQFTMDRAVSSLPHLVSLLAKELSRSGWKRDKNGNLYCPRCVKANDGRRELFPLP